MKRKSLLILLTVATLLIAMVPALAMAGNKKHGVSEATYNDGFQDVGDSHWAIRHINKLYTENIINGYLDNTFQPNKPVTRAEAVVMVLKATTGDAVTSQVYSLPFKDAKNVPKWAASYISQAVEKGLLPADVGKNFQANKPASRLWTATLLVRAQNLTDQVYGQQESVLPFTDVDGLSVQDQAYIAVAMANNLIQGYPDNTFKPNKGVTRAELAVMLGKADEENLLPEAEGDKLVGIVVSVEPTVTTSEEVSTTVYDGVYNTTSGKITIKSEEGTETTYTVASNVKVFIGDKLAKLTDLTAGARVELILGTDGTVVYIEVRPEAYVGTIVGVDTTNNTLTVNVRGAEKTFAIADSPVVTINKKSAAVADLKAAMRVKIQLTNDKVTSISAVSFEKAQKHKGKDNSNLKNDKTDKTDKATNGQGQGKNKVKSIANQEEE